MSTPDISCHGSRAITRGRIWLFSPPADPTSYVFGAPVDAGLLETGSLPHQIIAAGAADAAVG